MKHSDMDTRSSSLDKSYPRVVYKRFCLILVVLCSPLELLHAQNDSDGESSNTTAAPGSVVVDEEAAVRALESALVRADVLLLAPGSMSLNWSISTSIDTAERSFLFDVNNDDGSTSLALGTESTTYTQLTNRFSIGVGVPFGLQFGLSFPVGQNWRKTDVRIDEFIIEEDTSTDAAAGDPEISIQKSLLREAGFWPDLVLGLAFDTAAGSVRGVEAGVGSNGLETTVSLSATKSQDPIVFSASLSHTFRGDDSSQSNTSLSFASYLAASPYTSLQFGFRHTMFGQVGEDGEYRANRGSSGLLTIGGASVLGQRTSLSYDLDVGLSDTAGDYSVSLGLSYTVP